MERDGSILVRILLYFNLLFVFVFQAKTNSLVSVKLEVLAPPPCVINNNKSIDLDFGEVMTSKINGENYKVLINYTLSCNVELNKSLQIQVFGESSNFDSGVLKTSKQDLGIRILHGDSPLPINSWLKFGYPEIPILWAVPVKNNNIVLKGGGFTGAATMKVSYY